MLSLTARSILEAALALPEEERIELAHALWASQTKLADLAFDPSWLPEIQRRSAEIDARTAGRTPWLVVRERVRRLGG